MKRVYLLLVLICLLSACIERQAHPLEASTELNELIDNDEVFKARRLFESSKSHLSLYDSLIYSSILDNSFNAPASSNRSMNRLFKKYSGKVSDTKKCNLLKIKLQNHVKLFEYKSAFNIVSELVENYYALLNSTDLADFHNQLNLWEGCAINQHNQCKKNTIVS